MNIILLSVLQVSEAGVAEVNNGFHWIPNNFDLLAATFIVFKARNITFADQALIIFKKF